MRRLAVVLLGILVIGALAAPAAAAPSDPFRGVWTSIDDPPGGGGDLSNQRVAFGGGGETRRMTYLDDWASICGGDPAIVTGHGTVSGNVLTVPDAEIKCVNGTEVGPVTVTFEYDPATGTLTDTNGIIWHR